jgi:hypothetical protein
VTFAEFKVTDARTGLTTEATVFYDPDVLAVCVNAMFDQDITHVEFCKGLMGVELSPVAPVTAKVVKKIA